MDSDEVNKLYEAVHRLINRGIIAPGAEGNYGMDLPYFHVTDYGMQCISNLDILPYDIDGYLSEINQIENLNEWIKFYIGQGLECFNNGCYEASLIMVGLANELIVEEVIKNYIDYLSKNDNSIEKERFSKLVSKETKVSRKYLIYRESLKVSMKADPNLKKLNIFIDNLANETFMSYMRLTRNELAHPSRIRTDRITNLMIYISFIKYCEMQYKFINYYLNV